MNPLLLAGAAYLLMQGTGTKKAAESLQFTPIGVKKKDGKLNLIATVINPRGTTIKIDGVFLTFFVDLGDGSKPSKIGMINIEKDKAFQITKHGTSTVYLPITVAGLGLVALAAKIALLIKKKGKDFSPQVKVIGTIVTMGLTVTVDKTVPLDINL